MAANYGAIEKQHRHVEAVAAHKLRVVVHVPDLECRQRQRTPEPPERGEHLLAQLAAGTLHEYQRQGRRGRLVAPLYGQGRVLRHRLHLGSDETHGVGRHLAHRGHLVTVDHG
jgi:hypothetical protein